MNEVKGRRCLWWRPYIEKASIGEVAVVFRRSVGEGGGGSHIRFHRSLQEPDAVWRDARCRVDDAAVGGRGLRRCLVVARRVGLRRGVHRSMMHRSRVHRTVGVHALRDRGFVVLVVRARMVLRRCMAVSHGTHVLHQRQATAQEQQHDHRGRRQAKGTRRGEHGPMQRNSDARLSATTREGGSFSRFFWAGQSHRMTIL